MSKTAIVSKVEWSDINWRKAEFSIWKLQKRIYRASSSGNIKLVRKCDYCGLSFKPDDKIEKHHLIPRIKGGKSIDKNLALLHLHCHDRIYTFTEVEYDRWVLEKTIK